ncbi:MAG TPA: GNAT family N-acetyltransferase [Acidimicrobiales bacterium]|nr:GNAT family N-acetyltransferase [Acidimicrobiales bacterium]
MEEGSATERQILSLRALSGDDWREWRELRLQALAEAPYAFSSTLAEWTGPGDSEERWRRRLADVAYNVLAVSEGQAVGMVSCTSAVGEEVELVSMWVAPWARGRGVGDALVEAVVTRATEQGARRVVLAVWEHNEHAVELYLRHGFVDGGPSATCPEGPDAERKMVREI